MTKNISYKNTLIRYSDNGKGVPLIFLHGYLLALDVWLEFTKPLVHKYRVICIDLPGHGESGLPDDVSGMDVMAGAVKVVLDKLMIDSAVIIGHSMGGYTALALLDSYPEVFKAIILFHSHTLADNDEVKKKRDREVRIIDMGQRNLLISQSIPNMFATDTLPDFNSELVMCKSLARQMTDKAVKAAILGLRSRHDSSVVLENARVPCLNIIGRKDNFIDFENVAMATKLPAGSERLILERAGHMGFFEEPQTAVNGIDQFLKRIL